MSISLTTMLQSTQATSPKKTYHHSVVRSTGNPKNTTVMTSFHQIRNQTKNKTRTPNLYESPHCPLTVRPLLTGNCWASLPIEVGHGAALSQPDLQMYSSNGVSDRQLSQRMQGECAVIYRPPSVHFWVATSLTIHFGVAKARGFELSYLGKLSQVRDTHTRQPLLHHVCVLLMQLYPQSSDLYSDITAVTKAGKVRSVCNVCVCAIWI